MRLSLQYDTYGHVRDVGMLMKDEWFETCLITSVFVTKFTCDRFGMTVWLHMHHVMIEKRRLKLPFGDHLKYILI